MEESPAKASENKLPLRIIVGLIIGIIGGVLMQLLGVDTGTIATINSWVKPIGDIFLRMIFMMVVPLLICAIINGVSELGDLSSLGRIGKRTLIYTVVVSIISVFIGLLVVGIFQPGSHLSESDRTSLIDQYKTQNANLEETIAKQKSKSIGQIIVSIVPKNPLQDMVHAFDSSYEGGGLLAVMFFAIMVAIALRGMDPGKSQAIYTLVDSVYELTMKIIGMAMQLAPIGVASILFVLTSTMGYGIIKVLLIYMLVCLLGLGIHLFITYGLILKWYVKKSPIQFFQDIKTVMLTAFSTSSSNATLPTAIQVSLEKLKLPRQIVNFVLTIGSTANQNGTALYEGVTILFIAQCFGVDLSFSQQLYVMTMCILAGIGTAGVPGGSLPVIAIILSTINIPPLAIGIIMGIDRILDMSRTVLNVTGDIVAAEVIHKWENTPAKSE